MTTLLRLPDVCAKVGLRRSAVFRLVKDHKFAAPVKLTERAVAWREADLNAWCDERPSARAENAPGCKD